MLFHSYFWTETKLLDNLEQKVLEVLLELDVSRKDLLAAYELLLRSDSTPAQCIVLDNYSYTESYKRWGQDNPYELLEILIRQRIDQQLDSPPFHRSKIEGPPEFGANHASAFHAAWILNYNCGAERIVNALKLNNHPDVILEGIRSIDVVFSNNVEPNIHIVQMLIDYAKNVVFSDEIRCSAIRRIGNIDTLQSELFLVEMTSDSQFNVVATAAQFLGERDLNQYRLLLKKLSDSWSSEQVCSSSIEVRDMLNEE